MGDLAALVAYLDPGGPDEGPPWEWLNEYGEEFGPPAAEPEPGGEAVPSLAAYAAHRERGLAPAAAAYAAFRELEAGLQMEAG
jgi:hypothetical protein